MTHVGYGRGGYGNGKFGDGGYPDSGALDDLRAAYADTVVEVDTDGELYDIEAALAEELDRITFQSQLPVLDHTVATALGGALDRIGLLLDVTRRSGESDDSLRQRIILAGMASIASGTTNELMQLTAEAYEVPVDSSNLSFPIDLEQDPATFKVEVDSQTAREATLDTETIDTILEGATAAGHAVEIQET